MTGDVFDQIRNPFSVRRGGALGQLAGLVNVANDCCELSFFFSSRRRHTRLQGDWSSDVCSSDLHALNSLGVASSNAVGFTSSTQGVQREKLELGAMMLRATEFLGADLVLEGSRSEERRVGKECRSRWSPYH